MFQLVAPSPNERQSWLTVLNNGVPFSTVIYDTTRSLPETPLDSVENFELIEEDNSSLENYEIMTTPGQVDEEDDIYNELEDLSPQHQAKVVPPPAISIVPPALPQTKRPSLLTIKKPNAPAPPAPVEDLYDDTGNVAPALPQLPTRPKAVPPPAPLRKQNSSLHAEIYDDAGARDDVYDDAGGDHVNARLEVFKNVVQNGDKPLAVKNQSSLLKIILDDATDDVYDDAGGAAPAKPAPKQPAKIVKAAPPAPPVRNVTITLEMDIYDDAGAREDIYDDAAGKDDDDQGMYYDIEELAQSVRAQNKKPNDKPPPLPPLIAAMKSPGKPPDPPSTKKKPSPPVRKVVQAPEPEGEEYDEVGPAQTVVPPPLPAANSIRPVAKSAPPPPPLNRKPEVEETYDEVAPPKDLASELSSALKKLNKNATGNKPAPSPAPSSKSKPAPQEDIRNAGTLTNQLAKLKPINSIKMKSTEKTIEIVYKSPPPNEEEKRPGTVSGNKFKQADSAASKKFSQPNQPPEQNLRVTPSSVKKNGTTPSTVTSSVTRTVNNPKPATPKPTPANKSKFETAPQNNTSNNNGDPPAPRVNVRNMAKKIGQQLG